MILPVRKSSDLGKWRSGSKASRRCWTRSTSWCHPFSTFGSLSAWSTSKFSTRKWTRTKSRSSAEKKLLPWKTNKKNGDQICQLAVEILTLHILSLCSSTAVIHFGLKTPIKPCFINKISIYQQPTFPGMIHAAWKLQRKNDFYSLRPWYSDKIRFLDLTFTSSVSLVDIVKHFYSVSVTEIFL